MHKGKAMKVQVIAHNGVGRGSRIIVWATRGEYSHLSLRFILSEEEVQIFKHFFKGELTRDHEIEAIQFKGVHHQPFVPSPNQTWFDFEQTQNQSKIIFGEAIDKIGCGYDWLGIKSFLTRKDSENKLKWFCSELVAWCLLKAGIRLLWMACFKISPRLGVASTVLHKNKEYELLKKRADAFTEVEYKKNLEDLNASLIINDAA